ncbi:MAG: biopolymer transporter ExbD [Planctomycetaceae bacterium]
MPLKTEPLEEPQLILTPVIDIMFLLLIFFMVGTQFVDDERYFDIKLPTVSDAMAVTSLPDPATVNVTAAGDVILDGQAIALPELESRLVAMRENYPGQAVVLRGDGSTSYQQVMDVLAVVKKSGITGVSLANRPAAKE